MIDHVANPDEWFLVIDETNEDPGGQPEEEPTLSGPPALLLRRLREMIPTW